MSDSAGSDQPASIQNGGSAGVSVATSDVFSPTGLKVLVVDDDLVCLKGISTMLQRCSYEVTTCNSVSEALTLLRERNKDCGLDQFDLVLSDVYMPGMDGFKLLEHIGLELDVPVILMSTNGDTKMVLHGVTHGAVDFLIKPVHFEVLKNVWQHVVRRRSSAVVRAVEDAVHSDDNSQQQLGTKRKESDQSPLQLGSEQAGCKKPRVIWSVEMHQQFVNAVNTLGIDKAVPKRILDFMTVAGLTRENVASHLQKYRLYLKRVEGVKCGATDNSGHHTKSANSAADGAATGAAAEAACGLLAPKQQQQQKEARKEQFLQQLGTFMRRMQVMPPGLEGIGQQSPSHPLHQAMAMQAAAAASLAGSMPPCMTNGMLSPGVPGGFPGLGGMLGGPQMLPSQGLGMATLNGDGTMHGPHQQPIVTLCPPPPALLAPPPSLPPASTGPVVPTPLVASTLPPPPACASDGLCSRAGIASLSAAAPAAAAVRGMSHLGHMLVGRPPIAAIGGGSKCRHGPAGLFNVVARELSDSKLPADEVHQLAVGGFSHEDPLMRHLGDITFPAHLPHGMRTGPDDFLDLFLDDSTSEEL